ncbi:MAG: hypothetical protein SFU27_09550 [Thermonemataceae bacterium]|nr:hypothetical protein [Thermonemataceae bacterium]
MGLLDFKNTLQQVKKDLLDKPKEALLEGKSQVLGWENSDESSLKFPQVQIELQSPSSNSFTSIQEFITEIKLIENTVFSNEQTSDTAFSITQMRKIYYDNKSFDILISKRKSISSIISNNLKNQFKNTLKTISLSDYLVDIGHVFVGLDVFYNDEYISVGVANPLLNISASTWAGDLGSVLGEMYRKDADIHRKEEWNSYISKWASPEDMLGNIDGLVIAKLYPISSPKKVSDILADYYMNSKLYNKRFQVFASILGLNGFKNGDFVNEDSVIERMGMEITSSANFYLASYFNYKFGAPFLNTNPLLSNKGGAGKHLAKYLVSSLKKLL